MRKMVIFALCLTMILGIVGCQSAARPQKDDSQSTDNSASETEELTVYYFEESYAQGAKAMIDWYQRQKDSITVNAVGFKKVEELKDKIKQDGMPDVLLIQKIETVFGLDPFSLVQDELAADLTEKLAQDTTFEKEQYLAGVIEAGQANHHQYVLPLSVETQYLLAGEQTKAASALGNLAEDYTLEDLGYALQEERRAHEGEELYCAALPFYFQIGNTEQWLYDFLEQTGALHIDRNQKQVEVDEAAFNQVLDYFKDQLASFETMYTNKELSQKNFVDMQSFCTAMLVNGNAPYYTRYCGSAYSELLNQELAMIPFPMVNQSGSYAMNVNIMGLVGAKSEKQDEAYTMLRMMMDMPKDQWEMVNAGDPMVRMSPVNREIAQELIASLSELSGGKFKVQGATVERQALTEKQAETLKQLFENTERAYILDASTCEIIGQEVMPYIEGKTDDLNGLAERVQEAIEANLN